ncbi:hypothetical protein EMIHUDRAFT_470685, partial [Emiliania huxleyi CCMP1516]|uniref:BRCT domain-containing protein n=2 Tax=Emiliania huxleyi TaxID=2903 RepID=A0A0D3IR28_EMIH1
MVVEPSPSVSRTIKLLVAVSVCDIVTPEWVDACRAADQFVPVDAYLLGECTVSSKGVKVPWDAAKARTRAAAAPCLRGRTFYITKTTSPDADKLKIIIEKAGGATVETLPTTAPRSPLVVVCTDRDRRELQRLQACAAFRRERSAVCRTLTRPPSPRLRECATSRSCVTPSCSRICCSKSTA